MKYSEKEQEIIKEKNLSKTVLGVLKVLNISLKDLYHYDDMNFDEDHLPYFIFTFQKFYDHSYFGNKKDVKDVIIEKLESSYDDSFSLQIVRTSNMKILSIKEIMKQCYK